MVAIDPTMPGRLSLTTGLPSRQTANAETRRLQRLRIDAETQLWIEAGEAQETMAEQAFRRHLRSRISRDGTMRLTRATM